MASVPQHWVARRFWRDEAETRVLAPYAGAQLLVELPGLLARLRPQLPRQRRHAGAVGLRHPGAVAPQRRQAHQVAVGRLVRRVVLDQPPDVGEGGGVVPARLRLRDGTLQQAGEGLAQPRPLGQQPLVVELGQQVAPVEPHRAGNRLGRVGLSCGRLELRHVEGVRRVGPPGEGWSLQVEIAVGVGQGQAQVVDQPAQVGARLPLTGVGPVEIGQLRARLRHAGVQHQPGHQRLQARRVEGGHRTVARDELKPAQELQPQGGGHRRPLHVAWPC